jgi:hypothetical protein
MFVLIKSPFHIGNVKQVVLPQPADSVYVDPPSQDQYYAAEDIASNSSIGRPFFYQVEVLPCFRYEYYFIKLQTLNLCPVYAFQGYPASGVSASQIQEHPSMQAVPQCVSQVLA